MGRAAYIVRIIIISLVVISLFSFLAYHLYEIQILRHDELYVKAKKKYTAVKDIYGRRGLIYDYDGNLLVGNAPGIDIRANPQLLGDKEQCQELASYFARKLNVSVTTIFDRLSTKERNGKKIHEVVVGNAISLDLADKIKHELEGRKVNGIYFYDTLMRYYPKNELLSNILGIINIDQMKAIPVSGIEKAYNSVLSPGKVKVSVYERSRDGVPLTYGNNRITDVASGNNIYLTISEPIQSIVEEEIGKLMDQWKPKAIYAIMVNPKTGSILAMAQRPTFNPNNRTKMDSDSWRDRIATDGFEPGSIMKPLVVVKALDLGIVKPDTKFDCENGCWFYAGKSLRDAHRAGILTVFQIVQESSNIGTAKISLMMGARNLYNLFKSYGFGKKTGLPFNPQATGIFRDLKKWDALSITRFPIGQGILVSPLQLIGAYTALANGGKRMRLRIVDNIEDPITKEVYKYPIKSEGKIIENEWAVKEVVEMMKAVTQEGGTAKKASIPGYQVAGKTGTSQKWINGEYSHSKYFASFIGFVPANDPAFLLLVAIDEPQGSYYGGSVAAPAFREIAIKTLRYLDIPPTEPEILPTGKNKQIKM